jgi:hypothetical protein
MPEATTSDLPATRGKDGGPFYTETPAEIRSLEPFSGSIAEPWNAATAFLFVIVALAWIVFLRRRLIRYPFLTIALPILLVGGIGGTCYHGLRNWIGFFLLDVIPIWLLGLSVSIYWWIRLGPRVRDLAGMLAVLSLLQLLGMWQVSSHWMINLSYAMLALLIVIPLTLVLVRTRGRHAGWIATALIAFGIAWLFRVVDVENPPLLPMGTHWLWHTFGAITTAALSIYVYRIEGLNLRKRPVSAGERVA